jgi:putative ABC transport system permease protein
MLKFLPLLWANLNRKRLRTSLTLASIIVAFLLFGIIQALRVALTGTPELAGVDRLVTMHKVSLIQPLPYSYLTRIRAMDGIEVATALNWFGGVYQDDRNQIAAMIVDAPSFLQVYGEYVLPEAQQQAWLKDRGSAIVGRVLAQRFGWNVGDTVPLRSNIWMRSDGTNIWPLKIAGIYNAENGDNQGLYLQYEYFNESRALGRDSIGWVVERVEDPSRSEDIARRIDAMFANSSAETKTATEKAFIQGFANQLGNIGALLTAIASAVFFTMLLVTANTMGQSIRERLNEIAVLKTLGFSDRGVTSLVFAESLLITASGGILGLLLASGAVKALGAALQQYFPLIGMPPDAWTIGAALILVLGSLAAALPCYQAARLRIADALRQV